MNTIIIHGYWGEERDPFRPTAQELALVLSQTADLATYLDEAPHASPEPAETETPW
jgi:hypothetical protein